MSDELLGCIVIWFVVHIMLLVCGLIAESKWFGRLWDKLEGKHHD